MEAWLQKLPCDFRACEDGDVAIEVILNELCRVQLRLQAALVTHTFMQSVPSGSYGLRVDTITKESRRRPEAHTETADVGTHEYDLDMFKFSFAFSGDLSPTNEFTDLANGVDLLIHEATFEDCLEHEAAARNHCTISQACKSAVAIKAKIFICTHFSQRYPAAPSFTLEDPTLPFPLFAVDLVRVPLPRQLHSGTVAGDLLNPSSPQNPDAAVSENVEGANKAIALLEQFFKCMRSGIEDLTGLFAVEEDLTPPSMSIL